MRTRRPILKQDHQLTEADFAEHAIWVAVHGLDQGETWYDDSDVDESTFRPWEGPFPPPQIPATLLVSAELVLASGVRYPGAIYVVSASSGTAEGDPSASQDVNSASIEELQPRIFVRGRSYHFWHGMMAPSVLDQAGFFSDVGIAQENVFPIRFASVDGLLTRPRAGLIQGFLGVDVRPSDSEPVSRSAADLGLEASLKRGEECLKRQDLEHAKQIADELVDCHIRDARAWEFRSRVTAAMGDARSAASDARNALALDPQNYGLCIWTSLLCIRLEDYSGCLAVSSQGLDLDDGNRLRLWYREYLWFLGARALYGLKQFDRSLEWLGNVSPTFRIGQSREELMSRRALQKACKQAFGGKRHT